MRLAKPEIRSTEYETNPRAECPNDQNAPRAERRHADFGFRVWVIGICFGFRVSSFEFGCGLAASGGRPMNKLLWMLGFCCVLQSALGAEATRPEHDMVYVPAGEFVMGTSEEEARRLARQ